jgi:EAL domain-containing protein (putative c-di-GMP-specific phosphodiesterase class I)
MPLGDWVIPEACQQLAERNSGISPLGMSVNLAASQFSDRDLPARIQEIMVRNGLPAGSIDLEVTESMTMKSPSGAVAMMKVLTGHGQSLTIDDFGTGYSSLAYLKLFPISTLKIDRSFVKDIETDPDDASICDITVLLAHKLGMEVVAEGVETEAQLKYLLSIGCEKIQGYLISKPLPAEQMERFIRNYTTMTRLGTIDLWT